MPEVGRVRCLSSMLVESSGCAIHPNLQSRGANIVFVKMKNNQEIRWKDLMDPEHLLEQQLLNQPTVDEKQLIMEKAEAERLAPHEVFAAAALAKKYAAKTQAQEEEQEKQQLLKKQNGKSKSLNTSDTRRDPTAVGLPQKPSDQRGSSSSGLDPDKAAELDLKGKELWNKKMAKSTRKPWNDHRKTPPSEATSKKKKNKNNA